MATTNPVLGTITKGQNRAQLFHAAADNRPMTVDDVITATGITLATIVGAALVNVGISVFVSPGLGVMLMLGGALGAFITVIVSSFARAYGSKAVTLTYAVLEGLALGGFSYLFAGIDVGGSDGATLIGQAMVGTFGVFGGMLYVYKTGTVKVTPKFNRILTGSLIGVLVVMIFGALSTLVLGHNPLLGGGIVSIIFTLVCIVLAALSFLQDFDSADQLVRAGAPAKMSWGVALGLAVTLVWLYTEILRLLSYFSRD